MYCEWGGSVRFGRGEIGNCILSKYPMSDCTNHIIHPFLVPWSCLEAYVNEVNCRFFVTHLASGIALAERSREMQAHDILEIVHSASGPKVLMGDFNTITSNSKVLSIISKEFKDVLGQGGVCNRCTYPSFLPRLSLDHIFVSREISVTHVDIPKTMLSDHLPIVVELTIFKLL
jgi:endonuclease/exonuclease/phosphatase family metal-dependent hydrolase